MPSIKSMTGFASVRVNLSCGQIGFDLKSVNSRYLELNLKLPENFKYLEGRLREVVRAKALRGKFEVILAFTPAPSAGLTLNTSLLTALTGALGQIKQHVPEGQINLMQLLLYPGVIAENATARSELDDAIAAALAQAMDELITQRTQEGARLTAVLRQKLDAMEEALKPVATQLSTLVIQEREKLTQRLNELKVEVNAERLEQEVALLAQKADIAEEYDRLRAHIAATRDILQQGGSVGKRLDFLMQEFNREANTLASKASNLALTQIAVELKVLIEQMREQVQNLE